MTWQLNNLARQQQSLATQAANLNSRPSSKPVTDSPSRDQTGKKPDRVLMALWSSEIEDGLRSFAGGEEAEKPAPRQAEPPPDEAPVRQTASEAWTGEVREQQRELEQDAVEDAAEEFHEQAQEMSEDWQESRELRARERAHHAEEAYNEALDEHGEAKEWEDKDDKEVHESHDEIELDDIDDFLDDELHFEDESEGGGRGRRQREEDEDEEEEKQAPRAKSIEGIGSRERVHITSPGRLADVAPEGQAGPANLFEESPDSWNATPSETFEVDTPDLKHPLPSATKDPAKLEWSYDSMSIDVFTAKDAAPVDPPAAPARAKQPTADLAVDSPPAEQPRPDLATPAVVEEPKAEQQAVPVDFRTEVEPPKAEAPRVGAEPEKHAEVRGEEPPRKPAAEV
ncbi:MAG: hypothetical protein KC910_32650, partial [Candidatus Eremiobacteraeota bacterium]|nr:hypothetical protein [Candidatus Eremiobacteraeota bacterium]